MDLNTKRRYKKYAIVFSKTAWSILAIFIVLFVLLMIYAGNMSKILLGILSVTIVMSLILALVFNFASDLYRRNLIRYMGNIKEYRIRRKYVKAMKHIQSCELIEARKVYKSIPENHRLSDYLYIALTHEFIHSDDDELSKKGIAVIDALINHYDPEKYDIDY